MKFKEFKELVHTTKKSRMDVDLIYRIERNISVLISYAVTRFLPFVSPNHISLSAVLIVVVLIALPFYWHGIWAFIATWLILKFTTIFDRVDGEIARFRNLFTQKGIYYDRIYHTLYILAFYLIIVSLLLDTFSENIGIITATFVTMSLAIHYSLLGKIRHHIKYKIKLENHGNVIQDPIKEDVSQTHQGFKFADYAFVRWYDWSWFIVFLIVLWSYVDPIAGIKVIGLYMYLAVAYIVFLVFYSYPKRKLLSSKELLDY